jgi:hypothetical protein
MAKFFHLKSKFLGQDYGNIVQNIIFLRTKTKKGQLLSRDCPLANYDI